MHTCLGNSTAAPQGAGDSCSFSYLSLTAPFSILWEGSLTFLCHLASVILFSPAVDTGDSPPLSTPLSHSQLALCSPAAVAVQGAELPAQDPQGASSSELTQSQVCPQNLCSLVHCFLFGGFFPLGTVPQLAHRGCSSLGRN